LIGRVGTPSCPCPESNWPQTVEPGAVLDDSAANTVDAAQCGDAKNSGDQNAIRQFCPESDWPQTVE
jgi:hypothetical protein